MKGHIKYILQFPMQIKQIDYNWWQNTGSVK